MLLLALGAGWAANQDGRWPFLGWLARDGGQPVQEAGVEPVAESGATPQQAPDAVTEQTPQPGTEHAENAPLAQEPAAGPSVAAPSGTAAPAPSASAVPEAAVSDMTDQQTGAPAGGRDQAAEQETPPADSAIGTETTPATGPLVENPPAASANAPATEAVAASEQEAADQPGDSDTAEVGPPSVDRGPEQAAERSGADTAVAGGDAPARSGADASEPQATAEVTGEQDAPSGTQPGGAGQPAVETGAEVAAIAPGAGQEPGAVGGAADVAASDPAREVADLLSESKATDPPSFDIVRVEPDGRAVIAGRAAPGAEVELRSGDQVIDRVRASRRGDWVAIPGKPLSPGDQQLTAVAAREGKVLESQQMVVVAVPQRASPVVGQVDVATPQPMAVLLPRTGRGTGRVLQAPGRLSAAGTLALMTVGYDQLGQMLLSGEAPPGVPVRVYVDNQPVALVVGDANGTWSSGLDQALAPGTYTLRLDQLDAKGATVARIETPIIRVSEPPVEGELQVDYVVVQPGNSLWRIARRLTGKGVDYVYIYDSNQGQIRDPDLIYPGQVFQIPAEVATSG